MGIINDGKTRLRGGPQSPESKSFGHCAANYRNADSSMKARIIYRKRSLELWMSTWNNEYKLCFRKDDIELPNDYYFGVSAATSDHPDDHDLVSLDVFEVNAMLKPVCVYSDLLLDIIM